MHVEYFKCPPFPFVDINECDLSSDVCRNGNCTNTDGSYYCTCNEGFEGTGNNSCSGNYYYTISIVVVVVVVVEQ